MFLARLAVLLYVAAIFGGVPDVVPVATDDDDYLSAGASPVHDRFVSDDADGDDDDQYAEADYDDDFIPNATPAIVADPAAVERLTIVSDRAPPCAVRDPLFRPPRLSA